MDILTTDAGWYFLARYGHFLFGITWVGMLFYFNFVQAEYFKEADAAARTDAFVSLVPRALWWFRWGAAGTFLTGLALLGLIGGGMSFDILVGALLGTLMFLNVWLVIWPQQRILIASNVQLKAGGEALPEAAAAAPRAMLASRTNTLFSAPMLFFMGASAHYPLGGPLVDASPAALVVVLLLILALEVNGLYGKAGPLAGLRGVIGCSFGLTAVLWAIVALL
ncbi:MAG TPA: urate hydroxylase PuuD [Pseudomonadales bacterium]|nr:urate hydroxylase PuuD [Pseudomonadales bacterium]